MSSLNKYLYTELLTKPQQIDKKSYTEGGQWILVITSEVDSVCLSFSTYLIIP
mgnify:CR=1 FL=1